MAGIWDWSGTASSNTLCDSINVNTGMAPANVDNVFRSMMAIIRQTFASALQNFFAGTAPLPVANGGTGGTDAATALSALGALSSSYARLIVINKAATFSPSDGETGSAYNYLGGAAAMTLNPASSTPMTVGSTFLIRNGGSAALTITRGSGVSLAKNGSVASSDAILAVGGLASLTYWGSDFWTITGSGIG